MNTNTPLLRTLPSALTLAGLSVPVTVAASWLIGLDAIASRTFTVAVLTFYFAACFALLRVEAGNLWRRHGYPGKIAGWLRALVLFVAPFASLIAVTVPEILWYRAPAAEVWFLPSESMLARHDSGYCAPFLQNPASDLPLGSLAGWVVDWEFNTWAALSLLVPLLLAASAALLWLGASLTLAVSAAFWKTLRRSLGNLSTVGDAPAKASGEGA